MSKSNTVQQEAMAVSNDMRELYSLFKAGVVDRNDADSLANIAGKNLKALSIVIADQMREDGHIQMISKMKTIEHKQ
jgi:hypothetical protein